MTFEEARLSLLFLAETGYGGPLRAEAYAKRAREDAAAKMLGEAAN